MKSIYKWSAAAALTVGLIFAQSTGVTRTIVTRADISVPGREAVITRVEIAPGAAVGRHTHPGDEITYVLEGQGDLMIEGRPTLKFKAGDGFVIPGGLKHDAYNSGTQPLKLVAMYAIEKGKPLATPAP